VSGAEPKPLHYGSGTLADLLGSATAGLGAPWPNPLDIELADTIIVLLIDGLGELALRAHVDAAPCLTSLSGRSLTAGFPTTTATSLASIGTGEAPGLHGIVGYSTFLPDQPELSEPINWLKWCGARTGRNLLEVAVPEEVQPHATVFERAAVAGIASTIVAPGEQRQSGLTRAVFRGGNFRTAFSGADVMIQILAATGQAPPHLIYAYIGDQDLIGHIYGPDSDAWTLQLAAIDRAVELLIARLPHRCSLIVTADHGMVDVPDTSRIDYDTSPALKRGVIHLAGEGRARFIHVEEGQRDAVQARWQDLLGARVAVRSTGEAVADGWFGHDVTPIVRARIGDLVAVSADKTTIVRHRAERYLATMRGQHGALSNAEVLVPLLEYRA
jgi:Type I phosphodiesterase / nucleotide pyrophosphatase